MTSSVSRPASSFAAVTRLLDLRPAGGVVRPHAVQLGIVAGRSGPRFLVPLDHRGAAPEVCLSYLGLRDVRTRITRGAVGWALRAHADRLVARERVTADGGPGSLIAHLAELLHDPDQEPGLAVGVGLGQLDEVWKPTLQIFRPDGTPAAFVKIGLGPVAKRLVTTEAATLRAWGRFGDPRLVVPELIAESIWNDIPIAVIAPLPLDARRLPPGTPPAWPVRELDGPAVSAAPTEAPWWTQRRAATADHLMVDALLDQIESRHGDEQAWARWHGDWVPWNLARCHRGLVAWDWEYSEPGAPVGLDEVHGAYQQARVLEGRSISESLALSHALRDTTFDPAGSRRWLADAHVAMLLTRSTELEQLSGTPPRHQPELLAAAAAIFRRRS